MSRILNAFFLLMRTEALVVYATPEGYTFDRFTLFATLEPRTFCINPFLNLWYHLTGKI